MSAEIATIKREIVEKISFDYFQVADGWIQPQFRRHRTKTGYKSRSKARRIDRKIYVWKLRKDKVIHTPRIEKPLGEPVRRQGFALLTDIRAFQEIGLQNANIIRGSIFTALTPVMLARIVSSRKKSYLGGKRARAESRCKNPFDMLKNKKAKLYFWDGIHLCTLCGRILVTI